MNLDRLVTRREILTAGLIVVGLYLIYKSVKGSNEDKKWKKIWKKSLEAK
jgi:hypothetical protein